MASPIPPGRRAGHAVVVGASIAGLCVAAVLSETFEKVTVIDRDVLPDGPQPRRGVPQSRQAHGMLSRGSEAFDTLFPGFSDELVAAGGAAGDSQLDFHWYLDGYLIREAASGLRGATASRPLIEFRVRRRVTALPGVEIRESTEALDLVATPDRQRVTGVRVRSAGGTDETLSADLVVDASGRGARARVWLGELGHPAPPRSEVRIDVVYVTRFYRREPHHLGGRIGALTTPYPGQPRNGAVMWQEDDRFVVLLAGMAGEEPPTDDAGMLEFAESLDTPEIADVIRTAEPLTEAVKMRYPASVRNHYEKLDHHVDGLLVVGDALACFNPVYGQGMTIAALEALLLRDILAGGRHDLPQRYFPAAAKLVDVPWTLAVGGDLRFPQVAGKRGPADRFVNRYLDRYRAAASVDAHLGTAFLRVSNLIDPPATLFAPGNVLRVLRSAKAGVRSSGMSRAPR